MKKLSFALRVISCSLVALVALVFLVLEATLLVTLDFTLYENQLIALVQLILRFLIASSALTLGIFSLVKRKQSFLPYSICLLVSSVIMIPFMSNGIGIYLTAVSALFLASQVLSYKTKE